jgi:AcrR family transcriptional regulator
MADAPAVHKPLRGYRSPRREEQARRTRSRVLAAAHRLFVEHGYAATTMRATAAEAGVSVPTVELVFGTKPQLLKAVIDVAIAGDDQPVPVLHRDWAASALSTRTVPAFIAVVAQVVARAQTRSASLIMAAYEAAPADPEITALIRQLETQRTTTVGWIVDGITERAALRTGTSRESAIDTVWLLMDPAVFRRLTHARGWSPEDYEKWFTDSVPRLLLTLDASATPPSSDDQVDRKDCQS